MAPIPEGARLLSLPHERDTLGGGGGPSLKPGAVTNEGNAAANGFSEDASPYGCLISTLRSREEIEAGKERYRYSNVYLHFPPGLLRRADEQQSQQTMFLLKSGRAPSYAQPGEEARPGAGPGGGVRMAQCRLPGGSEKLREQVQRMVREQLQRFSEEDSWIKDLEEGAPQGASLASGRAPTNGAQTSANAPGRAATQGACLEYTNVYFCTDVYVNGGLVKSSCKFDRSYCSVRAEGEDFGGNFGDGGGGGDDMDRCDSYDGGPTDQLCSDGPGGGGEEPDEKNVYKKKIPQVEDYNAEVDTIDVANLPSCGSSRVESQLDNLGVRREAWKDYCESSLPNATQRRRIRNALNRIENRGRVCKRIAQRRRSYLNNGLIYIDPIADRAGGWGYAGLVIIWADYVNLYHKGRTKKDDDWENDGNLDFILVHEFDHVMGEDGHIRDTFNTTHEEQCSGLDI